MRCIAHVGVFKALAQHHCLNCVKEVLGISAGALFSLLFVLEYTIPEIERLSLEFDFNLLQNIDPDSFFNFPLTFGLDSGAGLEKFISTVLIHKGFKPDVTFEELQIKKKIRLRCFAADIQQQKIKEFSAEKTPKFSVKTALRASMSLPILFQPIDDPTTGRMLMDGGVLHNLPIVFQEEGEISDTLAVLFTKTVKDSSGSKPELLEVFQQVYDCITFMRNKPYIKKYKENILCIEVNGSESYNFEEPREKRVELIESARKQTEKFLFTSSIQKPVRRFSCH
jgi:predicted acylesterase/phospholipase RssA